MLELGNPGGNPGRIEAIKRFLAQISQPENTGMFNPEASLDMNQVQKQTPVAPHVQFGQDRPPLYDEFPGLDFNLGPGWQKGDNMAFPDDYPEPYIPEPGKQAPQGVGFADQGGGNLLQQLLSLLSGGR